MRTRDPQGSANATSANSRAAPPDETATPEGAPTRAANSLSNAATSGPLGTHPEAMSSRVAKAYCLACTSTNEML